MRIDIKKIFLIVFAVLWGLTGPTEAVEVIMKSGRIVQGDLIQETTTSITLQLTSSQIEISKLTIKSIDGRSPFEQRKPIPASTSDLLKKTEVRIPMGHFLMGDTRDKKAFVHKVHLEAFWIDTREVTNAQYREFVTATTSSTPRYWKDAKYSAPDQPVVGISWTDADAYCQWKNRRLPTEAEWERAARGTQSRLFPWGDRFDAAKTNTREAKTRRPLPVGTFLGGATTEGLFDMSGNVWEWCQDWFEEEYYRVSPLHNPEGPASGKKRVIRGGGWSAPHVHMAKRRGEKPDKTYPSLGFRCARPDTDKE